MVRPMSLPQGPGLALRPADNVWEERPGGLWSPGGPQKTLSTCLSLPWVLAGRLPAAQCARGRAATGRAKAAPLTGDTRPPALLASCRDLPAQLPLQLEAATSEPVTS